MSTGERPDILIIVADQLTPSALPCHGNPVTQAPALSWLAESGVVFDAAGFILLRRSGWLPA